VARLVLVGDLHNTPIRGHEKEAFERLTGREPSASVLFASFSFPAFDLQEDVPDSGLAKGVAPAQRSSAAHVRWQIEHGEGYSRMASLEA
jgi:hypothetical protein